MRLTRNDIRKSRFKKSRIKIRLKESLRPSKMKNSQTLARLILFALISHLAVDHVIPSSPILQAAKAEEAPRITIQPNDLIAIEGEATELNCDAEGDPEPIIEWFHNGQLIRQSSKTRTTMAGSIQFLDVRPPNSHGSSGSPHSLGRPSDVGVYHCLARNSHGEARSRNASLQVAYIKEQFRAAPKDKFVPVGESAAFDCLPEAWPEPQIQWRFNGQLIDLSGKQQKYTVTRLARTEIEQQAGWPSNNNNNNPADNNHRNNHNSNPNDPATPPRSSGQQLQQTSSGAAVDLFGSRLQINQIDKSDEGKYSCSVETKGSHRLIERESAQAQLLAFVKPYFIESPKDVISQLGGQAKLRCRLGGDPEPVVSWRKQNGQPLSEKTQIDPSDKTLAIEQLSQQDQGNYICEGENSAGSARASANIAVHSRPKFSVQPNDQELEQGAYAKLNCAGDASPPPMLFWYKEGHRQLMFPPNANQQQFNRQQQHFVDAGPWHDQQSSPASSLPQAAALTSAQPSSNLISSNSDTSPAINKLFTMPSAFPSPLSQDNQLMTTTTTTNNFFTNRIHVDNHGALHIANVTPSDSGFYACALVSPVGSVLAKAKLIVKPALSSLSIPHVGDPLADSAAASLDSRYPNAAYSGTSKFDLLPPPVIKFGSPNQTLPTDTSVTLNCEVYSQVPYKIQWFFENQPLQVEPNRVMLIDNGALQINQLKISDSGIYTCVVTAASDQVIPLANPSEPFDASMLTSAPPVQQTTSHSTLLRVANPMNPNIPFYRVDIFTHPSSPGPATLVSTNGNYGITITWAQPPDSGSLPIKEYIIEHYDTSQEHLGWRVIYNIKGKESLLIDGLSSEGSHYFVIRAVNGKGVGPSSSISNPMRTVLGEVRYQQDLMRRRDPYRRMNLEYPATNMRPEASLARDRLMSISTNLLTLTPISSSSIRLQWSTQVTGNLSSGYDPNTGYPLLNEANEFLEGYSIRYRAIKSADNYIGIDPLISMTANVWPTKPSDMPLSLPLVTSYIEPTQDNEAQFRDRRDLINSNFDFSQEFNEIRVADRNTEQYTVNGLKSFTLYQFFIVPYYIDIDGIPSNFLTSQTQEDRPSIAPPNLTIHAINNTAVRLLWIHIPRTYANGFLRGYLIQFNKTDIVDGQQITSSSGRIEDPKIINIPLGAMTLVPYGNMNPDPRAQTYMQQSHMNQYVAIYDLTNLTYKSFYSIQVAGYTSPGPGPFTDAQNFFMDPVVLSQLRVANNEIDDVMSKTMISSIPEAYNQSFVFSRTFIYLGCGFILLLMVMVVLMFYRRDNDRVSTWKKTISEHFNNKFYIQSNGGETTGPNPFQQNIYDHNKHLIYSRSNHINQPSFSSGHQQMWPSGTNNGCLNASSGTGSLSSHGGLLPLNADPNNCRIVGGEQFMLMNTKEINNTHRFAKPSGPLINEQHATIDTNRRLQSDYYSDINTMAEYEELETHQRNKVQSNSDRNQTASSNSDTSCPNSVTRLIPNQNYNREILTKKFNENYQRQDHQILHNNNHNNLNHMTNDSMKPSSFATMGNGLSPYATTNLMSQNLQQHQFVGQMSLGNYPVHNNGNLTINLHHPQNDQLHQQLMNGNATSAQQQQQNILTTLKRNQQQQLMRNKQHYLLNNNRQQLSNTMQPDQVPFIQQLDSNEIGNVHCNNNNMINQNCYQPNQYQDTNQLRMAQSSVQQQQQQQTTKLARSQQQNNNNDDMKSNLYEPVEYSDESISQTDKQISM